MMDHSGNKALAGDIVIEVMTSLSDAVISAFQWCDDLNISLCPEQKKQIFNAYVSVIMDMRERVCTIIELDDIARDIVGNSDKNSDSRDLIRHFAEFNKTFQKITIDIDTRVETDLED